MNLTLQDLRDLVTTTKPKFGDGKYIDLTTDIQKFWAMPRLLKTERMTEDSGKVIQRQALFNNADGEANFWTTPYAEDNIEITDAMKYTEIPWRLCTANFSISEPEVLTNREPARINDLLKTRRYRCYVNIATYLEKAWWTKPVDSNDNLKPFGLEYWVVPNATAGFNGGNASGFSGGPGGIDASLAANARWRNYTGQYTDISKTPATGLLSLMNDAYDFTQFEAPVPKSVGDYKRGDDNCVVFTTHAIKRKLELIGENQNENLGRDLASMAGKTMFRGCPIEWVPYLESGYTSLSGPVYMLNLSYFEAVVMSGYWLKEKEPIEAPNQHMVVTTHIDGQMNFNCTNRRAQTIFTAAA